MVKVRVQAPAESVNNALEDRGDFVLPPTGLYVMKVTEVNAGFSKSKDGSGDEDKTRPRLEVICQFVAVGKERKELPATYGQVWHYVSFSKESADSRANFFRAFYPESVVAGQDLDMEIDTDELIEREFISRIKHEVDKMKTDENKASDDPKLKKVVAKRARIARFFPVDSDEFEATENANDAFAEPDADEANPFEEPDAQAQAEELLTEEELNAMDIKELGAVAKEFDLDPNDFIVKNKAKKVDMDATKAAVVAAVLEAQGADDAPAEGGDDGDDASPF